MQSELLGIYDITASKVVKRLDEVIEKLKAGDVIKIVRWMTMPDIPHTTYIEYLGDNTFTRSSRKKQDYEIIIKGKRKE